MFPKTFFDEYRFIAMKENDVVYSVTQLILVYSFFINKNFTKMCTAGS